MKMRRKYTIKRVRGQGVRFACEVCGWEVATTEFDAEMANLRTQAAAAMNRHIRVEHPITPGTVKVKDSRI